MNLRHFHTLAASRARENKKFLSGLKRKDACDLDKEFHKTHDEVFAETNCLECANCCKTTSPIFYPNDIDRAARALRMKPGEFVTKYLAIDKDNDYVLRSVPCPFLSGDNTCNIYEDRPKACRDYPHTNRKKMIQVLDLAWRNTMVCPAVLAIVERLKKKLG